jgi:predicted O-methyltransferase YrrM
VRDFEIDTLKYMTERFAPIPTHDDFLDSRYRWQMVDNGQEWPYYRFFYHLSKWLQPDLVVELGSYQGTAAAHFAAGCKGKGQVVTIDHHTDPGDECNKRKTNETCKAFDNILYIQGWTNPEAALREYGKHQLENAINALPFVQQLKEIDVLFIDSWHTYDNAMLDWKYYKPLLNSPALVICDDIQDGELADSPIRGMMRFWNEMPEPKFLNGNLHPGTMMGFLKWEV